MLELRVWPIPIRLSLSSPRFLLSLAIHLVLCKRQTVRTSFASNRLDALDVDSSQLGAVPASVTRFIFNLVESPGSETFSAMQALIC